MTILTHYESLSCFDIMTWLGRYGEVVNMRVKNCDEFGIWSGPWTFSVKLRHSGGTVAHISLARSSTRDNLNCVTGAVTPHNCMVQGCALCREVGHLAGSSEQI